MKKYFTWQYINSPSGHRLLLIIALAGLVLLYIFHVKPVQDALEGENKYLRKDNAAKDSAISLNLDYIDVLTSSNSSLRKAVDKGDYKIITIHEKTKNNVDAVDGSTVTDLQGEFNRRYDPDERNP